LLSAHGRDKQTYQNTKIAGLFKFNPNWQKAVRSELEPSKPPFFLNSVSGFFSPTTTFNLMTQTLTAISKTYNDGLSARL